MATSVPVFGIFCIVIEGVVHVAKEFQSLKRAILQDLEIPADKIRGSIPAVGGGMICFEIDCEGWDQVGTFEAGVDKFRKLHSQIKVTSSLNQEGINIY